MGRAECAGSERVDWRERGASDLREEVKLCSEGLGWFGGSESARSGKGLRACGGGSGIEGDSI